MKYTDRKKVRDEIGGGKGEGFRISQDSEPQKPSLPSNTHSQEGKGKGMSLINEYFLWYKVWNRHELLKNAQRQIMIDAVPHANSKQMAEYLLNALDFDSRISKRTRQLKQQTDKGGYQADYVGDNQIEKIHEVCSEQIRSDWDAPITQEQFEDTLLLDAMQEELKKVPEKVDVKLRL